MSDQIIREVFVMTDEMKTEDIPFAVLQDLQYRIRQIESNIPPRVQTLENTVEEIRREFREIREEQKLSDAKTDQNFKELALKLEASIDRISENQGKINETFGEKIDKIVKKLAYWAGGLTVVAGIGTLLVTKGDVIIPALQRIFIGG